MGGVMGLAIACAAAALLGETLRLLFGVVLKMRDLSLVAEAEAEGEVPMRVPV